MSSNLFTFKQFVVKHQDSTMKVGTDAVLLGSYLDFQYSKNILDVGTGCGVIALIAAQKSQANQANITAIDIHKPSVEEANYNFKQSPWRNRLTAVPSSFQDFSTLNPEKFDLIISNPPFFDHSLKSPSKNKSLAKHNDHLFFDEFAKAAAICLQPHGKVAVILPAKESELFMSEMTKVNYQVVQECVIYPKPSKPYNRKIMVFQQTCTNHPQHKDELIIRNEDNGYTDAYKILTQPSYVSLK